MKGCPDVMLDELQLLTGIVTKDADYLIYLLLKDGSYFDKEELSPESSAEDILSGVTRTESLGAWFSCLEEI